MSDKATKLTEGKERVISTARKLTKKEMTQAKLREKYKIEKAKKNEAVKQAMEADVAANAQAAVLSAWRNTAIQAWQEKIETDDFSKEQLAQGNADLKALRKRLKDEIDNVDQLDIQFDP